MNNKFKISVILKDIMNWFICSCGIVLLLMFFNHEVKEQIHSDRDVIYMVSIFFISGIFLMVLYNILSYGISMKSDWIVTKPAGRSLAKKKEIELLKNVEYYEEKKLVSIHEAGHAVVALALGVNISCVQINMDNEQMESGKTILKNKSLIAMDEESVKDIVTIKYAGAATEKLIYKKYSLGSMGSIDSDFESAEELIKQMIITFSDKYNWYVRCGNGFDELVCQNSQELFNKAQKIVEENIDNIRKVAGELMHKNILNQEEVREIMKREEKA